MFDIGEAGVHEEYKTLPHGLLFLLLQKLSKFHPNPNEITKDYKLLEILNQSFNALSSDKPNAEKIPVIENELVCVFEERYTLGSGSDLVLFCAQGGVPSSQLFSYFPNAGAIIACDGSGFQEDGLPHILFDDKRYIEGLDHHPKKASERYKLDSSALMKLDLTILCYHPLMDCIIKVLTDEPEFLEDTPSQTGIFLVKCKNCIEESLPKVNLQKYGNNPIDFKLQYDEDEIILLKEILLGHIAQFNISDSDYTLDSFLKLRALTIATKNTNIDENVILFDYIDPDSLLSAFIGLISKLLSCDTDISEIYKIEEDSKNLYQTLSKELLHQLEIDPENQPKSLLTALWEKNFLLKIRPVLEAVSVADKYCGVVFNKDPSTEMARELINGICIAFRTGQIKSTNPSPIITAFLEALKVLCSYSQGTLFSDYTSTSVDNTPQRPKIDSTIDPQPPLYLIGATNSNIIYVDGDQSHPNWRQWINRHRPDVSLAIIKNSNNLGKITYTFLVTSIDTANHNTSYKGAMLNKFVAKINNFFELSYSSITKSNQNQTFNLKDYIDSKNHCVFQAAGITGGTRNNPSEHPETFWLGLWENFLFKKINEFLGKKDIINLISTLTTEKDIDRVEKELFSIFINIYATEITYYLHELEIHKNKTGLDVFSRQS